MDSDLKNPIKIDAGTFFNEATNAEPKVYWRKSSEKECLPHTPNIEIIDFQVDGVTIEGKARIECDVIVSAGMNEMSDSSKYKELGTLLGTLMVVLFFHICISLFIVRSYIGHIELNYQLGINFPLKNSSVLPSNLSYGLKETYVLSYDKSYGVVFSHDNLESEIGNSLKDSVSTKRLFPLIRNDYMDYLMIPFAVGTGLSTIITVLISISIYAVCMIVIYCKTKMHKKKAYYSLGKKSGLTEFKQSRHILIIWIIVIFYHLMASPFIIYIYIIKNAEYFLDIPLKKTSNLPAKLSYSLDDAFVFQNDNFYGLLFTHKDLIENFFINSVSFTPLLSLIQSNFVSHSKINISILTLYLSSIISALSGLFIWSVHKIISVYCKKVP